MTKRLFVPDCHVPYHDARAFWLMLEVAKDFSPDEVVVLGDFWDCYVAGNYTQDPTKAMALLEDELKPGRKMLAHIENYSGAEKFVFIEGNHENRITRYFHTHAPKLGGILKTRSILQVPEHWTYLPCGQEAHYDMEGLVATHGTLSNKYVCANMLAKYGCSVIFGHTHRIQRHVVRSFHGQRLEAITCGWLGDVDKAAEYINNVADFSHGFAIGYFEPDNFWVEIIQIKDYACAFNGKIYR